ncbi:MAG: hypothetical protein AVDCRST_MAG86-104 [uncultured Truepera sp.]|uniref:Uncharacterized protein n=1 Tax=uncultured Truepera sp. TaxID=543023 RepID=A0A6J4UPA1_9DEIN|nr:MAG: hypothetical protein AVDCRST_MAG86-104 [uncultured Truepera sp.]
MCTDDFEATFGQRGGQQWVGYEVFSSDPQVNLPSYSLACRLSNSEHLVGRRNHGHGCTRQR